MSDEAAQLAQGVAALGLALPAGVCGRLLDYLALLRKWNRTYNLTAVREPARMVSHHVLDSLAVLPHLGEGPLLDVGSGAGLPGIPIALARPHTAVTLLDANEKKAAFLRQAKSELKIDNIDVVCERVERWSPARRYAVIISRALGELARFIELAGRHLAAGGTLAAMKGVYPDAELAALPSGWGLRVAHALRVPGLDAARHLLLLEKA